MVISLNNQIMILIKLMTNLLLRYSIANHEHKVLHSDRITYGNYDDHCTVKETYHEEALTNIIFVLT